MWYGWGAGMVSRKARGTTITRSVARGTGITRRIITHYDRDSAEAKEFVKDIAEKGSQWAYLRDLILEECNGLELIEWPDSPDEPGRFAEEIRTRLQWADAAADAADDEGAQAAHFAALFAFQAGELRERALMKFAYELDALRGKSFMKNPGGNLGKVGRDTLEILAQMDLLKEAGHSTANAAHLVHERGLGASKSANEKLWRRHNPRK